MESGRRFAVAAMLVAMVFSGSALAQWGGRGYRFNQGNTPGWTLMTPAERTAYRDQMLSAKTYRECHTIWVTHRKAMEARAREKGVTLNTPRFNACDRMKARGLIK